MLRAHCIALAMLAASARAQDGSAAPAEPTLSSVAPTDDEARGLFLAGEAAFRDQRWDDALEHFRQAYALSPRPGLLYNVGVAADRLRRDREALEAFEQFIEHGSEDDAHLAEARARVRVLREAIARNEVRPPPVLARHGDPTAGWGVFLVSSAVALGAAVLLVIGELDAQSVEGAAAGTPWPSVADAAGRADLLRNLGWILLAAGGAGAAIGLTWAILESNSASGASARLELGPAGLRVRGVF